MKEWIIATICMAAIAYLSHWKSYELVQNIALFAIFLKIDSIQGKIK